jgi:hypothetical protein
MNLIEVKPIKSTETTLWLLNKHYAKRLPSISYAFGLYVDDVLSGVVTYGSPPSPPLCVGLCGKEYRHKVLELNRLIIDTDIKNSSSMLVGRSLKQLPPERIIVSFADTSQGHVGYIYQATNFLYTGLSAKRTEWAVKGLESNHARSYAHKRTTKQMKEDFGDDFYYRERSRKHRYVTFTGNKSHKKQLRSKLLYEVENYPKGESKRYDSSGYVAKQMVIF